LLDAGILVDVYLAMTGGQSALALDTSAAQRATERSDALAAALRGPGIKLPVSEASAEELRQHEALLDVIQKASGGKALWRLETVPPVDGKGAGNGDGTHKNH